MSKRVVLVTGAAGFIGFHLTHRLLEEGAAVIGLDNLNPYYDVCLKRARLSALTAREHFTFVQADLTDRASVERRRYRIPGRIAPWLANAFWRTQKKHIRQMEARQAFLRTTLNRACAIISPSQFLRSVYIEEGVPPERIIFSRQGRDFPDLTPELLAKTPSDVLRVGYIGQLGPVKGVHVLFEAVRRLSDARLVARAYGNPAQFPHYMKQLRRLRMASPGSSSQACAVRVK